MAHLTQRQSAAALKLDPDDLLLPPHHNSPSPPDHNVFSRKPHLPAQRQRRSSPNWGHLTLAQSSDEHMSMEICHIKAQQQDGSQRADEMQMYQKS